MTARTIIVCDACGEPVDGTPCIPHAFDWMDEYTGDIHYHSECCPDCRAEEDAAEDEKWREFLANEYSSKVAEELGL